MSDQAAPPADQAAPAAPTSSAPWAADLEAAFNDPDVRQQVDGFMREKYQPYVTKLETDISGLSAAKEYYEDLTSDPGATWVSLTHEILGDEIAERVLAALQPGDEPAATATGDEPQTPNSALSAEDRALLEEIRQNKQATTYHEAVDAYVEGADDPDLKVKWFHPFVAAAGGNLRQAHAGYTEWINDVKSGLAPAGVDGAEEAANNEPPPTLGSQTGGANAPTVAKNYGGNLDAAIDDLFSDVAKSPPSVVGSV